jgi:hypothetical protein
VFKLFRALGLRHLVVVDNRNQVGPTSLSRVWRLEPGCQASLLPAPQQVVVVLVLCSLGDFEVWYPAWPCSPLC